jgi:transcription-repair coupling factor (superfamily II helicase)
LRGRVGRSRQRAFAYLLIPGEHIITRDAKRRIEALRELVESDNGGGFKLAIRDLEHRGAGNLLGREQSGQIAAVGFELYTEMREQAISELRGEPHRAELEPELKLGIPAYIPENYVADEGERLVLYRRMARAQSVSDFDEVRGDLRDRYGPIPTLIENLIAAMDLRRHMKELMIASALLKGETLEIRFHPEAPVDGARLAALVHANRSMMNLTPAGLVGVRVAQGSYEQTFAQLADILQVLASCEKLENRAGSTHEMVN